MQPLEIDSAVFCDGARYTIISRENSSILTCPVTSGAALPVREHAFTRRASVPIIRAISASPAPSARRTA